MSKSLHDIILGYVIPGAGHPIVIATVFGDDERPPASQREADSNARLIAAAPCLLAALKQLVADWESVPENARVPDEINTDEHWDAARSAIKKAMGEK
jgi:hypothetical protein